jgi:Na+/melibiose symporter-like transporter
VVRPRKVRIDLAGATLLIAAVTCLLLVATWGGSEMPWTSPTILGLIASGAVLIVAFAIQELRAPDPILPPRLFTNSVIVIANLVSAIVSLAVFGATVLLPVFFQLVIGTSPGNSGLLLVPVMGGVVLGAFPAGQLMRRSGHYRWIVATGLPIALVGYGFLATMGPTTSPFLLVLYTLIIGMGVGTTFPVMLVATQNVAEARDIGVATAGVSFFRSLGGAFGAAILWSILLWDAGHRLSEAGVGGDGLAGDLLHGRLSGAPLPAGAHETIVAALTQSFHLAFLVGAGFVGVAVLSLFFLKDLPLRTTAHAHAEPVEPPI